jgi:hypothetical protein
MMDTKGNPSYIIAGLHLNQKMDNETVDLIKSVYPLDDIKNILLKAANNENLIIVNKEKANNLLAPIGLQPSERSRVISLAKNTVSQPSSKSNTQNEACCGYKLLRRNKT